MARTLCWRLAAWLMATALGCADDTTAAHLEVDLTVIDLERRTGSCIALAAPPGGGPAHELTHFEVMLNGDGQAPDPGCMLFAARVDGGALYWVSGPDYDIELFTDAYDDDPVRHSTNTAEDHVVPGIFPMRVLELESQTGVVLWEGELEVLAVDASRVRVRFPK